VGDDVVAFRVRLVASHLDGTSERTRAVLDRLPDVGVDLVAVTGRPPRWVTELGLPTGVAICSNGALVVDLETGDVVAERVLAPEASVEIIGRLRALHPEGMMAVELPSGVAMERAWHDLVPWAAAESIGPAEELAAERPAAKILLKVPGTEGDAYIDAATEAVGDLGEVTASGGLQLVEVSAPGVTKATTLALVCDQRGIASADVVAFGDARNDLAMLAWAGWGVAMADAHPSVVDLADDVCASTDHDGVAAWLESHLLPPP
jgi:hydroxymethylpyrimidine pyrophosphatase-like HAD family hydrolase